MVRPQPRLLRTGVDTLVFSETMVPQVFLSLTLPG
jgi:hypothetical protein